MNMNRFIYLNASESFSQIIQKGMYVRGEVFSNSICKNTFLGELNKGVVLTVTAAITEHYPVKMEPLIQRIELKISFDGRYTLHTYTCTVSKQQKLFKKTRVKDNFSLRQGRVYELIFNTCFLKLQCTTRLIVYVKLCYKCKINK